MMREAKYHQDFVLGAALENLATPSRVLDDLEPMPDLDDFRRGYREAASRGLFIMNSLVSWALDSKNPRIALYQCSFALGLATTGGLPMEKIAARLGCTRAALSKGSRAFGRSAGIAPVGSIKRDTENYRTARIKSIHAANVAASTQKKAKK